MIILGLILAWLLRLYLLVLFLRAVLSWIPTINPSWTPRGPMLVICEFIYSLTDPPLRLARKLLPPLRMGGLALDTGFFVLMIAVLLAQRVVGWIFF